VGGDVEGKRRRHSSIGPAFSSLALKHRAAEQQEKEDIKGGAGTTRLGTRRGFRLSSKGDRARVGDWFGGAICYGLGIRPGGEARNRKGGETKK